MKKLLFIIYYLLFIISAATAAAAASETALSLEALTRGEFAARGIAGVTPLADGERYSQLSSDRRQIVAHSFRTGQQTDILFDCSNTKGDIRLDAIDGYILSPNEQNILIQTQTERIYRHSFTAVYYIYNIRNRTLVPLSKGGPQEVPAFSADGTQIAFVRDNNIFLVQLLFNNAETQVTRDGQRNSIINGKPDWVNEEEFSFSRAFCFNADGTMLAWIRYDETAVPQFSFPLYKGLAPENSQYADYPGQYTYKYPIAGAQNATVTVQSYDIKSHVIRTMKLPIDADGYVPRIFPTNDPQRILVLTQNRHQDRLDIYAANPRSTECKLILRDQVEPYITEEPYKNLQVLKDDGFVLMSERSGTNQLYLYDRNGTLRRQLTTPLPLGGGREGASVVAEFYGYDEATGNCYYAATDGSPLRRAVFRSDAKGKVTRLSEHTGTNRATFSRLMKYFINVYSNAQTPPVTTLNAAANGKTLATLEDNESLKFKVESLKLPAPEFFTFTTSEGVELNGYMVKPSTLNSLGEGLGEGFPVILYQYSGPGSQQVLDAWNIGNMGGALYERYLASQGFICVCVDGRGTGGRGAQFEKQTYQHLGQLEARDQVETALWLAKQPYVDASRIGIWGWSYGGYMTLMSMMEGRPVFAAGVAVAPVTSYRYYDSVYTERYMRTPRENPTGYDDSPITRAINLHGALLICHGSADDNVHLRNTAELTEALVQADKPFLQLVYTNRNHSIYGANTRLHLYRSITDWFTRELKP